MFKFEKEQKVFDISGITIGGQPGQHPTVMIGSIFYHGHKIVTDEKKGEFNQEKAVKLLEKEKEIGEKTGNPRIVDVCCSWPQAFNKFIEFIADTIDGPFTIDGTTAEVRMAGAKYISEVGLSDRIIYNSISPEIKEDEIAMIKDAKIKSAILLTFNRENPTILGKLEVLDTLLNSAQKAEIENILVDVAVLDLPDPGPIGKAAYLVKERYGLPVGAGTHNAVARWKERGTLESEQYQLACSVANVFPLAMGADFMLYGPVRDASIAYFYTALADAYVAFSMIQEFRLRPKEGHPLYKIFKGD
jgi:tetrahydromethanopterin S-methyltransferase subunit H